MDNFAKTYGQLCQNIWTTLPKHMDVKPRTYLHKNQIVYLTNKQQTNL